MWITDNQLDKLFPTATLETDRGWERTSVVPTPEGDGWKWRVPILNPDVFDVSPDVDGKPDRPDIDVDGQWLSAFYTAQKARVRDRKTNVDLFNISKFLSDDYYVAKNIAKDGNNVSLLKYFIGTVTLEEAGLSMDKARALQWKEQPYNEAALKDMLRATRYRANLYSIISELAKSPLMMDISSEDLISYGFVDNMRGVQDMTKKRLFSVTDSENHLKYKDVTSVYFSVDPLEGAGYAAWNPFGNEYRWIYIEDIAKTGADISRFATETDAAAFTDVAMAAVTNLRGRGIPPFKIPAELGGGEKYLLIYGSDSGLFDNNAMLTLSKDIHFVPVPSSVLLSASLPAMKKSLLDQILPVYPHTPAGIFYVVGYPGIFRFVSARNPKSGLIEWARGFGGDEVGYAWEEMISYKSARAPSGSIYLETAAKFPEKGDLAHLNALADQFVYSQDVIKCISPLMINYSL